MRLETEFFPQNLVSFYHNSAGCALRTLQIVLFKQALNAYHTIHALCSQRKNRSIVNFLWGFSGM